jgi:hypothetical protein
MLTPALLAALVMSLLVARWLELGRDRDLSLPDALCVVSSSISASSSGTGICAGALAGSGLGG